MGQAKREMERLDGLRHDATDIVINARAIAPCPNHDDVLLDMMDDEAVNRAYAIGTNRWKGGEVGGTREGFMDAIKSVIEESGDECYDCDRHTAE